MQHAPNAAMELLCDAHELVDELVAFAFLVDALDEVAYAIDKHHGRLDEPNGVEYCSLAFVELYASEVEYLELVVVYVVAPSAELVQTFEDKHGVILILLGVEPQNPCRGAVFCALDYSSEGVVFGK